MTSHFLPAGHGVHAGPDRADSAGGP